MSPQEQELEEIEKLTDQYEKYERLEKLLFKYPDYQKAYSNIRKAYDNLKNFDKAKSFFLKLIEAEPNNAFPYRFLADLLAKDYFREYELSKKYYEKAIELAPNDIFNYIFFAYLLENEYFKEYALSRKYHEKAIELNPNYSFLYSSFASLLKRDFFKEYELSRKYYEKAIALEPLDAYGYHSLANLLENEYFKEYELSRKYYEKAIEVEPMDPSAYISLAELLKSDFFKEYELSRKNYEKAIEVEPMNPSGLNSLALLLENDFFKEYELSRKYYEKAIEVEPTYTFAYQSLALLLENEYFKEYALAKKNYEKAFKVSPNLDLSHLLFAIFLANKLMDQEKARYHFNKAIELKTYSSVTSLAQSGLREISFEETKTSFIGAIKIERLLHLKNISIEIDSKNLKHLIITGHNGCGKTVLLNSLRDFLQKLLDSDADVAIMDGFEKGLDNSNPNLLSIHPDARTLYYKYRSGFFVIAHFEARRDLKLEGIKDANNVQLPSYVSVTEKDKKGFLRTKYINQDFLKYAVNQYIQGGLALLKKDEARKREIDKWITNFEKILKNLDSRIEKIQFADKPDYHFEIIPKEPYEKFTFEQLADGFISIFSIASELILRMSNKSLLTYEVEGLVLIDEPEAHLHLDLQKKILPILTELFPKVQFIVATHSPFVLSSLENAVVYDLEKKWRFDQASQLSYSGLVENFFKVNSEYSTLFEERVKRYEELANKGDWNEAEEIELAKLDSELSNISPLLSPDMYLTVNRIHKSFQGG
ncbi:MAG: AAA family ATPase [Leptospiraceae bacterium]|nr:AAA family ATPase [Leptospiraceae bacterium]